MIELRYVGPPALVSAFAQMLREEGLDVSFEGPDEHRGAGHDIAAALIVYVVTKPLDKLIVDPSLTRPRGGFKTGSREQPKSRDNVQASATAANSSARSLRLAPRAAVRAHFVRRLPSARLSRLE